MAKASRTRGKRRSDLAHRQLHRMLLRGQAPANGRLVEEDLGRMLGMGRSPVREALLRLEGDGLVEHTPNAGFRVRRLSRDDVRDLYEIRLALESLAIRMACRKPVSRRILAAMGRLCDVMEGLGRDGNWRKADLQDLEFHKRLIGLSGSSQLKMAINASHMAVLSWNRFLDEPQQAADTERSCQQHRTIIEHITCGQSEQAVSALGNHLCGALTHMMNQEMSAVNDELASPDSVGGLAPRRQGKAPVLLADHKANFSEEREAPS